MKAFARLVPFVVAVGACLLPIGLSIAAEGELRWGLHVTLAAKWLDPAETEAESGAGLIPGFAYSAPFEDVKIKK